LKPEDFEKHLQHVLNELILFFEEVPCDNSDHFMETIRQTRQKKYVPQEISKVDFAQVRDYIFTNNKPLYYELCHLLKSGQIKNALVEWSHLFCEKEGDTSSIRLFYRVQYALDKSIFINNLRVKKIYSRLFEFND